MITSVGDSSDTPLKGRMKARFTNPVFHALQRLWAVERQRTSIALAQDMPSLPLCWNETRENDLCFLSSQFLKDDDLYKFIMNIKESEDFGINDVERENSVEELKTESIMREH